MGPGSLPIQLLLRTGGDAYILVFIAWQVDGDGGGGRWDDTRVDGWGWGGGGGGGGRGYEGRGVRAVM